MGAINVYSKKKVEMKRLVNQLVKESLAMRINFSFRYYDSNRDSYEVQFGMPNSNEDDSKYFGESTISLRNGNNLLACGLVEYFGIDYWDNGNDTCEILVQHILKTLANSSCELIFEFTDIKKEYTKMEVKSMLDSDIKIMNLI